MPLTRAAAPEATAVNVGVGTKISLGMDSSRPSTLLEWDDLRNMAIMSDDPLSVATSTDGVTYRAVVQNIESEYGGNVWDLINSLNRQATKVGASKLEIKGIEIVNSDLNKIFQKADGGTLMGYNVNYIRNGSYGEVTLIKKLNTR